MKTYGAVSGQSLQSRQRDVEVTQREHKGQVWVSLMVRATGSGGVSGLQTCITPDIAEQLANNLLVAAGEVRKADQDAAARRLQKRIDSDSKAARRREERRRQDDIAIAERRLAELKERRL